MPRILLVAVFLAIASAAVALRPPLSVPGHVASPGTPTTSNEVLVGLKADGWTEDTQALGQRLGGNVIDLLPEIHVVRLGLTNGESVAAATQRLEALTQVDYVEPNRLLQESLIPNDTLFGAQSSYLSLIQAPQAWDVTTGSSSVIVAVLDSGIDITQPDIAGSVWTNPLEVLDGRDDDNDGCVDDLHGCNFVAPASADPSCANSSGPSIDDDNGHGTFVSGIIAGTANNNLGISGVAPGVKILPVKILDCKGGGTAADAAKGILYAAKVGARVANISFGADGESQTLAQAIHTAYATYGMVIVAATGNDGTENVTFPANLEETFAVGSSGSADGEDTRSVFSDWGPEVDFVAPGRDIVSTVPPQSCGINWVCQNNSPYAVASGTSFAAPLVSGLAALIISKNPNLSPDTVRSMIASTAKPLPDGTTPNWDGAGLVQMRDALDLQRYQIGVPGVSRQ